MKNKSVLLLLVFVLLLTSCSNKDLIDESKIPTISEQDYLSAKIVSKTDKTIYFKKSMTFSKTFPNANIIDLSTLSKPRNDAQPICIDDIGNIYYVAEQNENNTYGAIYQYNTLKQDWATLIETDENHNCSVFGANERYVLWLEDKNSNWLKASLNLLDLSTKENIKIYDYSTDPDTGLMYAWIFSKPIMIDDTIYFDDIVGKDKNGLYDIRMYSYSISKKKLIELDSDAKWPMEFQGDAAWLKMSNDEKNSIFYSSKQEKFLFKTENKLGTVFASSGDIIVANDYISQAFYDHLSKKSLLEADEISSIKDERISSYGIKLLNNNQIEPIFIVNTGNVTNPVTNGNLVGWYGTSVGKPLFYSLKKDALVEIDFIDAEDIFAYDIKLSNNFAMISCATENNAQFLYFFELESYEW